MHRLFLIMLALCVAVGGQVTATIAEPSAKHYALTTKAAQLELKRSIASMTSLDPKHIEIRATETVVSVRLVDTLYNSGPASDREYLASTIAALIEKDSRESITCEGDRAACSVPQARSVAHEVSRHGRVPPGSDRGAYASRDLSLSLVHRGRAIGQPQGRGH